MLGIVQILTIAVMLASSYLMLRAFGPRPTVLFTKEEKARWDTTVGGRLGTWFTLTNIVGTLTSLATVFLFFIGNAKLFGWCALFSVVTLLLGVVVTNRFTRRLCEAPRVKKLLDSPNQTGSVVASLFWADDAASQRTAAMVRTVSLLNLFGIIWLEFALFTDISARVLQLSSMPMRLALLSACAYAVTYFTMKYGIRGFVFIDVFQSPMILLGSLIMLGGALAWLSSAGLALSLSTLVQPIVPTQICVLFGLHVLALNSFIVLVTEPHWLRAWAFGAKETKLQLRSIGATGAISVILIVVGLLAYHLTGGRTGTDAIEGLLVHMSGMSMVFPAAFWIAGMAALFSTADSQIYSFLVVRAFNPRSGELESDRVAVTRPARSAALVTLGFCLLYFLTRRLRIEFEKIIFIIIPMSLTLLPAFFRAYRGLKQKPTWVIAAVAFYAVASAVGLLSPPQQLGWNLGAAVMVVAVAIVAGIAGKPDPRPAE